jgi:3-oxoacyl-[acyl-carrier protein] reductase
MGREVSEKMIMNRTEGVIINVGSIAGTGHFGQTSYAASKGAVNALSVTWAQELAMYGIRVAGINPGMCYTDMAKAVIERNKKIAAKWEKHTPMKRMSSPEEMAEGIKFIIENDFFCGRMLQIDGGIRF